MKNKYPKGWVSQPLQTQLLQVSMDDLFIAVPKTIDLDKVEAIVDRVCADEGLSASMKSTLKQYPGCLHWHFKNGKAAGVLEVTWWPRRQEEKDPLLWLSVHGNRMAKWIEPVLPKLKKLLETKLQTTR